MIRGLFYLILLSFGLLCAMIWVGQMHHLRQLVPDYIPKWTAGFADNAGVRRGTFLRPAQDGLPELTLGWAAKLPSADGFLWDVTLTGDGIATQAELVLEFLPNRVLVRNGLGTIDLAALNTVEVTGIIRLDSLEAVIVDLLSDPVAKGQINGQTQDVFLQDVSLGGGPIAAQLMASDEWVLTADMTGGASAMSASLKGDLQSAIGNLTAKVITPENLPQDIAQMLQSVGESNGDGVEIEMSVPLPLQ